MTEQRDSDGGGMVKGKIAFVTGGGSGIGRSTCVLLAREGARVVVADRSVVCAEETMRLLHPDPHHHLFLHLDVSEEASVDAAVTAVHDHFGRPADIVVNSAGIMGPNADILDLDVQDLRNVYKINFEGTFFVMRAFVRALREAKIGGSVVNLSSIGVKMCNRKRGHYAASKGAVSALTKAAAKEWAPLGVRCNAVLPGLVDTPMTKDVSEAMRKGASALGRPARAEEIAEVIVFLASDRSSYMTGAEVPVTGAI